MKTKRVAITAYDLDAFNDLKDLFYPVNKCLLRAVYMLDIQFCWYDLERDWQEIN